MLDRHRLEREMAEELEAHLAARAADLESRGLSPAEAARQARLEFGPAERFKEECRESRGLRLWDELRGDFRFALRSLQRNKGFSALVAASLALGIGANIAVFSVANAILLRPLPYGGDLDRLVVIREEPEGGFRTGFTRHPTVNFVAEQKRLSTMETVMGVGDAGYFYNTIGIGEPRTIYAGPVTAEMCKLVRVTPILGRCFTPEEEAAQAPVALLSHELWQEQFGADPNVLGRTFTTLQSRRNKVFTVVGVMPAGFRLYPTRYDLWVPAPSRGGNFTWNQGMGRLKPGVSIEQAREEARALQRALLPDDHEGVGGYKVIVLPFTSLVRGNVTTGVVILMAAAGLVLLIACANVANLLLSRGATRVREVAVRESLGAGRFRVCRQLLVESLVLTGLGGAAGLALAYWLTPAVRAAAPPWLPRLEEIGMDWRVVTFAVLISLASALLFGLLPALRLSRVDLADAMKTGGLTSTGGGRQQTAMNTLVVFQTAFCVVAMMGAGLLINTVARLRSLDLGIRPDHALMVRVTARNGADAQPFFGDVLDRVRALPGVVAAGTVNLPPPNNGGAKLSFGLPGSDRAAQRDALWSITSPGYFQAIGTPLLAGRAFRDADTADAPLVAVISESLARKAFPGQSAVGQRLQWPGREPAFQVIGVVGNVRHQGLLEPPDDHIYTNYTQGGSTGMRLVVRTLGDPAAMTSALKAAVRSVDPNQPLDDLTTLETTVDQMTQEQRFYMLLLSAFGGLALLLTALGVGGLVAYSVSRRTREIGLRLSLGATPASLLRLFGASSLKLLSAGVLLGAMAALGVTRYAASLLYEVTPTDPATFAAVTAVLLIAALAACWAAARRATKVDPAVVLRHD